MVEASCTPNNENTSTANTLVRQPDATALKTGPNHEVRILSIFEYKKAALALAEAFIDDHVARYFLDTPDREHWPAEAKWNLHVDILEYITYAHCMKGLATTVGPDYGCVALW